MEFHWWSGCSLRCNFWWGNCFWASSTRHWLAATCEGPHDSQTVKITRSSWGEFPVNYVSLSVQTWSFIGGSTLRGGSRAMKSWRWVCPVEFKSGSRGLVAAAAACANDVRWVADKRAGVYPSNTRGTLRRKVPSTCKHHKKKTHENIPKFKYYCTGIHF